MPRYELTQKRKQVRQVWRELPEGSRVVVYGRHSPGEGQSIHSQADAMRRWVEERGWLRDREFYDEAIEGSRSDRAAFQEMLAYLQQHPRPVDGVVVWNTSRFGRDQLDSQFYKADLRRRGYVVVGKEDGIEQSPLAPVLESMLEWKAQQDLAVIGADTKRGLEYLARNGYWPGGQLPKGYRPPVSFLPTKSNVPDNYWVTGNGCGHSTAVAALAEGQASVEMAVGVSPCCTPIAGFEIRRMGVWAYGHSIRCGWRRLSEAVLKAGPTC